MNTPTPEKKNLEYVLYLSRNAKTLVNDSPECFNGLIKTLVVPLLDNREPLQTTKSLGNSIPPSSIGVTEVETSAAPLRDNREPLQTTFLMGNSIPPSSIGVTEAETIPPSSVGADNAKTIDNEFETSVSQLLDNREPLQTTFLMGNSIPPSSIGRTEAERIPQNSIPPSRIGQNASDTIPPNSTPPSCIGRTASERIPPNSTPPSCIGRNASDTIPQNSIPPSFIGRTASETIPQNSTPPSSIGRNSSETIPPSNVGLEHAERIHNHVEPSVSPLLDNREPLQTNFLLGNSIPPSSIVVTEAETIGASGIFRTEEKTITAGSVGETEAETIPDDFSLAFEGNTSIFDSDSAVSRCFGDRNNMYSGVFVGTEVDIGQLQLDKKQGKHYFY